MSREPRVMDYEGSPYRQEFWEEADRRFEDAAERRVLQAVLPPVGRRVVEIGAGFGRLVDLYEGYDQIILLDYARSMLEDARARLGDRCTYVCADLYHLPFATDSLDTVAQIRVLHHVEDVGAAVGEVARVLCAGGSYVLEFANKRNLKAVLRHASGRQDEDPFDETPWEFVELNWNFHPRYVERALGEAGLTVRERRAMSHFRMASLKRRVSPEVLARADALIGRPLGRAALGPSQLLRAAKLTGGRYRSQLWRCPACGEEPLLDAADEIPCPACGRVWRVENGIHIFR